MTGNNDHISLFDSVEDILQYFKFRYCGEEKDVHLMLFDPQDGCYHSYLTSSTENVSEQKVSEVIKEPLKDYQHKSELRKWIERNVRSGDEKRLALAILQAAEVYQSGEQYTLPQVPIGTDRWKKALQIILSSLPSYYRWDICGYYDKHYQEFPYSLSIWSADSIYSTNEFEISGFAFNYKQPDGNTKLIFDLEEIKDNPMFKKIIFKKNYKAFHKNDIGSNYSHEKIIYDRLYDKLRSTLYANKFNHMLYAPVSLSQLYMGIIFIPFEYLKDGNEIDLKKLSQSADDFRIEKHRDFFPALEKLWLTEFDKMMFEDISIYDRNEKIIEYFCLNINYIVKCEKCFLVKHDSDNGIKSQSLWEWRDEDKSIFRVFDTYNHGIKLEELRDNAEVLDQKDGGYTFFQGEYVVVHVKYQIDNENYSIYLLTQDYKNLEEKENFNLLKSIIQHRKQLLYQKLQNIGSSLFPQIEVIKKYGTKAAVAAIISRNHSHHIGSHVSPRATVNKVAERLITLRIFPEDINEIPKLHNTDEQARELDQRLRQQQLRNAIVGRLKSDLDVYIQKKADFSAEIATEPVISTKAALFFSQVILPFTANCLLMDNLGANEGVRYTAANDSRIQFRLLIDGKETEAWFGGQSTTCNCSPVSHRKRSYAGTCSCLESTLQLIAPYPVDRSVALPGPLGEFAVYSLLENLIRNSIKHNRSWFQQDPKRKLEISINLFEIKDDPALSATHLLCEIWDNVTDPVAERKLRNYARRPLIDGQGRLVPDGWGLAEMRIMATLLRGECNFTLPLVEPELVAVKPKDGVDTLVYQFYLMKCRQIALIQKGMTVPDALRSYGIYGFGTLEELLTHQNESRSSAAFDFAFIADEQKAAPIRQNLSQLPCRLLIAGSQAKAVPGACLVDAANATQIFAAIKAPNPGELIRLCWQMWLGHLQRRHKYHNPRLMLFFQQGRTESPTKKWIEIAAQTVDKSENPFSLSVIYGDGDSNRAEPSIDENSSFEDLFFFDRHFAGWVPLASRRERFCYHHALDKGSPDFVPIMAAAPSWNMAQRLCEAAMLRVLVLDERVAEVAYNQLFQGEPKATRLYGGRERLRVGKWANIFIATHVCAQGEGPAPLHPSIEPNQYPRICLKLDTRGTDKKVPVFEVRWCPDRANACNQCTIAPFPCNFDVLILHYGLLEVDGLLWTSIEGLPGKTLTQKAHRFVEGFKPHVPQVVIDSGRGIPVHLPTGARFLPFSVIEAHLLQERLSKFNLTSALMGLMQNRG